MCPSLRPLVSRRHSDQKESAFLLALGDITVLGGGCPGDHPAHQTHTPHSEAPKPLRTSGSSFGLSQLLWVHETYELWGNSREARNLRLAGFLSEVVLCFPSGLTLGAGSCWASPTLPAGLLLGTSDRMNVALGLARPGGVPSQPLGSSVVGPWLWVLPGTFHRKEAGLAPHRACFVSPPWWGTVGEEMRTSCLQIPESTASSLW